jgi:AraC-like DNA-binding protein
MSALAHSGSLHDLPVTRMAHPLSFVDYLRRTGAPVDMLRKRHSLSVLCNDAGALVPLADVWGLFSEAAKQVDPDIGWRVALFRGERCLNSALLNKLNDAPTLYLALKRLVKLIKSESSHLKLGLVEQKYSVLFYSYHPFMESKPGYNVAQAYQLGVWCDVIRHLVDAAWNPRIIGLQAPTASRVLEEKFTETRINVNQPYGYISIPRSWLHRKLSGPHAADPAQEFQTLQGLSFAEKLALLVEPHLDKGYPDLSLAASILGCSERTVARALASCGTSYQAMIDELRFNKAKELLTDLDRPIAEVASRVGFSEQANFTRMFRRIGGLTPLQFRRDTVNSPSSTVV